MGSQEVEEPHYNFDSDGEPPTDQVGDRLTIIKKRQVVKTILEVGENIGKPGKPFIVTVSYIGYFAKADEEPAPEQAIEEKEQQQPKTKTLEEAKQSLQNMELHKPAPESKLLRDVI